MIGNNNRTIICKRGQLSEILSICKECMTQQHGISLHRASNTEVVALDILHFSYTSKKDLLAIRNVPMVFESPTRTTG